MNRDIEEIIKKLERVQDLLHKNRNDEASTAAYEAQTLAIFIRDKS